MANGRLQTLLMAQAGLCLVALLVGCQVDQEGFKSIDRYSIDMGYGLFIDEPYLYTTTNEGVELFEVSGEGELQHRESIPLGSPTFVITMNNGTVYVGGEGGVAALEVSPDGTHQVVGQTTAAGTFMEGLIVEETLAYVSDYYKGLSIVDVSNPANMQTISHVDLETGSWSILRKGDLLYLANLTRGLMIFDISDPAQPELVGVADSSRGARNILIAGDTLYLGTAIDGVKMFDITDRRDPVLVNSLFDNEEVYAFYAADGKLYCKHPETGITVYQMREGDNPVQVAYFNKWCHATQVRDGLIYFVNDAVNVIRLVE